jgi:hypothetical protein
VFIIVIVFVLVRNLPNVISLTVHYTLILCDITQQPFPCKHTRYSAGSEVAQGRVGQNPLCVKEVALHNFWLVAYNVRSTFTALMWTLGMIRIMCIYVLMDLFCHDLFVHLAM